jgi:hypothetical protein
MLRHLVKGNPGIVVALALVLPNVIFALLDKGIWSGDPLGYCMHSIGLYRSLFSNRYQWLSGMFVGYKAPLLIWVGQVSVAIGHWTGMMKPSLLAIPVTAFLLAVYLTYRGMELHFGSRLIALCGSLIVASSPLVSGLANGFWIEPLQVAVVAWFIYALAKVKDWPFIDAVVYLTIATSIALLAKVSSPLYVVVAGIALTVSIIKKPLPSSLSGRELTLLIGAFCFLLPTAVFYSYNWARLTEFARFAATDPMFGGEAPRLGLWHQYVSNGLFLPLVYTCATIVLFVGAFVLIKRKNWGELRLAIMVTLAQIAIFFFAWMRSINVDPRYFAPALPYFSLLMCWSVFVIGNQTLKRITVCVFALQWAFNSAFIFGLVSTASPYGMVRSINRTTSPNAEILRDLISLASKDASIIFDTDPELNCLELQYELAEKKPLSNWDRSTLDLSAFFGLQRQQIDTSLLRVDSVWEQLLKYAPDYYITWASRADHEKLDAEVKRIDKYSAATVPIRWAVADRVINSGLFIKVPFDKHPELLVFKRIESMDQVSHAVIQTDRPL